MQDIFMAAVPVFGAILLAVGGGLMHMARRIEAIQTELKGLRHDVQTIDQRIYEMVRGPRP